MKIVKAFIHIIDVYNIDPYPSINTIRILISRTTNFIHKRLLDDLLILSEKGAKIPINTKAIIYKCLDKDIANPDYNITIKIYSQAKFYIYYNNIWLKQLSVGDMIGNDNDLKQILISRSISPDIRMLYAIPTENKFSIKI